MTNDQPYVEWFRNSAPYINAHRGRTFVIQFGGEIVSTPAFSNLVHDIALLDSLGVRLVLVHGARPQIEKRLVEKGLPLRYEQSLRVTDEATLESVKAAGGAVRLEIEALLSMGVANSPMAGARIRVASGNFVIARPLGVRDGIDFGYTGEVRRVDAESIRRHLDDGTIVLVSPIGFSPSGQIFNLSAEEIATAIAIDLHAAKLLLLTESSGLRNRQGELVRQLTLDDAKAMLSELRHTEISEDSAIVRHLSSAIHACRNGIKRTHLLDQHVDGALIGELFTRDGVGTMISADMYDYMRSATIDDVPGILELISPLEEEGYLVRRSREKLEMDIARFIVMERDGAIIACAASHPFAETSVVELACLAVHNSYRNAERGNALLDAVEKEVRSQGAERLFVLTTRSVEWFKERGFNSVSIEDLPVERQALYNYKRNSKVLVKHLPKP